MGLKTDIQENITPINFAEAVSLEQLKVTSLHPTNYKAVFLNTDTGVLYSNDSEGSSGLPGGGSSETAVPFNQSMTASTTASDADVACITAIALTPQGRVDVLINGLSVELALDKAAYFSGDGGITARARGSAQLADLLYWNGSIAGYELDVNDTIDFDYLTSNDFESAPSVSFELSGGSWNGYAPGNHVITAHVYEEPPLESWSHTMDVNNYLKLFTSESATDLINVCQIAVNGVIDTFTILNPIGPIANEDKKIVDGLFKTYIVDGLTITIARGPSWPSFTL